LVEILREGVSKEKGRKKGPALCAKKILDYGSHTRRKTEKKRKGFWAACQNPVREFQNSGRI